MQADSFLMSYFKNTNILWKPFGPTTFDQSKEKDMPIFLLLSYRGEYLSQLMYEESFLNEEIANYINSNFLPVLIDAHDHPDVFQFYAKSAMIFNKEAADTVCAFLFHDLRPFFATSYINATTTNEHSGMLDLLKQLIQFYKSEKEKTLENAKKACEIIFNNPPKEKIEYAGHFPHPNAIFEALKQFEDKNGGYGPLPKHFNFTFLEWAVEQMLEGVVKKEFGEKVIEWINNILMGGVLDHVRGGVFAYSKDSEWQTPHFEKNLNDQAAFLKLLSKTGMLYPSPLVFDAILNCLQYLKEEMLSEEKLFFTNQASSSEGIEGLYHTFLLEEFEDAINNSDSQSDELEKSIETLKTFFNIKKEGNYLSKLNVISLNKNVKEKIFTKDSWELIRKAKAALKKSQGQRIPPVTNINIISGPNFLIASALMELIKYSPIDVIKQRAHELLDLSWNAITTQFIKKDSLKDELIIIHSIHNNEIEYFSDHVNFLECLIGMNEIYATSNFANDLLITLKTIKNKFFKDNKFFSSTAKDAFFCTAATAYDFKTSSALSKFCGIFRKINLILPVEFKEDESITAMFEEIIQDTLRNPASAGEALRSFTYPSEIYRVISIPKKWHGENKFISFRNMFLSRFIFSYHEDSNDLWEMKNSEKIELKGEGLDDFIKALSPAKSDESQKG